MPALLLPQQLHQQKFSSVVSLIQGKTDVFLKAFPSPAKTEIIVQHPTAGSNSMITISAIDGRSIVVLSPKFGLQQTTVDVSFIRSGVYVIKYENEGQSEKLKFIKL
ncbi:MAG: T9SS type A sorting domain-containing protein [Bacteroidota bacterium]|nr:T9SS type A sorting domain-containing protein [Bacteroidota bacterium]